VKHVQKKNKSHVKRARGRKTEGVRERERERARYNNNNNCGAHTHSLIHTEAHAFDCFIHARVWVVKARKMCTHTDRKKKKKRFFPNFTMK